MQIYLARNNQQAGPYTLEQLNQMLSSQQVLLTDLVWHQGMHEWKTLGELTQGQLQYAPQHSGATTSNHSTLNQSTATASTTHADASNTPAAQTYTNHSHVTSAEHIQAATVGSRIVAKLIDLSLLIVPQMIVIMSFVPREFLQKEAQLSLQEQIKLAEQLQQNMPSWVPIFMLCYTLALLVIQNVMIGRTGQSIGKKLLKIQIVDAVNFKLTGQFRGFFVRSFLFVMLSQLMGIFPLLVIVFIVDLVLFFSSGNNSLHDRLAKTKVIKFKPH